MRKIVLVVVACAFLGGTGHVASLDHLPDMGRVGALLTSIFGDVEVILKSFSGGPDDPNGPIRSRTTLNNDESRLDQATRKAEQLAQELYGR